MSTLDRAIQLAAKAHAGQRGKDGQSYILHPIRVMLAQHDNATRIVGVLHDVAEHTDMTLDDLKNEGYSRQIIEAVDAMTRRDNEDYLEFVRRAGSNALARSVKIADLKDNLRTAIENGDGERRKKYENALAMLG